MNLITAILSEALKTVTGENAAPHVEWEPQKIEGEDGESDTYKVPSKHRKGPWKERRNGTDIHHQCDVMQSDTYKQERREKDPNATLSEVWLCPVMEGCNEQGMTVPCYLNGIDACPKKEWDAEFSKTRQELEDDGLTWTRSMREAEQILGEKGDVGPEIKEAEKASWWHIKKG